jgi:molybdate/tungstate transport system substrate-binding protein
MNHAPERNARQAKATRFPHVRGAALGTVAAAALLLSSVATFAPAASASQKFSGNVNVLYAASLQDIMENTIGPAFQRATGYTFTGFSGASGTLANEIKGGVLKGDVFISAATSVNATLEGAANGNWVNWFVVFGSSPLVLGYNPSSTYAAELKTEPWWEVITQPGIRLGRTDPTTDPKGKLTVQALTAAANIYNDPALTTITTTTANVYPEQTLVGLLQSQQLDMGFFYSSEAKAAGIPTVKLGKLSLAATYTVATLANAPDAAASVAFVDFLLGTKGSALLKKAGVDVVRPRLTGSTSSLPKSVRLLIKGR